jgi:CRP-like cAMP-binding protein
MLDSFKKYVDGQSVVTAEQFAIVMSCLTPMRVNKGTILFRQGEVCPSVAFVVKGCLRSYITDENNKAHILEFAPENWWIGDVLSLHRQLPSLFYIDAIEDSELLLAKMDFFVKMPQVFPEFYQLYIYHMHEGLRSIQKRVRHLLGSNAQERYIDFLATYPELGVRLPQHMIASYLGISPESLSRIRNKFANKQ